MLSRRQSPIDIRRVDVEPRGDLPPVTVHYPADPLPVEVCFGVVDGDETPDGSVVVPQLIVTAPDSGAHVVLGGTRFDLQSFHWHTPSEHLVDGEAFPLELHLVHRSSEGSLLVVGVLSSLGAHDDAIAPAFDCIPSLDPSTAAGEVRDCHSAEMRLADLVPSEPDAYRYDGSLTTAPFTEGVSWLVCSDVRTASQEQVDAHMTLVSTEIPEYEGRPQPPGNARAVQALAGRTVVTER